MVVMLECANHKFATPSKCRVLVIPVYSLAAIVFEHIPRVYVYGNFE